MPAVFCEDELQELQVQVLLLIGEYVAIYDSAQALTRARALIPDFEGELMPGSNHNMCGSHYQSVYMRVIDFQNGK